MPEAIYFRGVNISHVETLYKDPVPAPPRRVPTWGATSQFFLRSSSDPALAVGRAKGDTNQLEEVAGQRHQRAASRGAGRPMTAGGVSPTKRHHARGNCEKANPLRQRPASAPILLRNEDFVARRPYEGEFRQHIENVAVTQSLSWMKREGLCKKAWIDSVDPLKDTSLFDLKVLHNGSQRARTKAAMQRLLASTQGSPSKRKGKRSGRSPGGQVAKTPVERLKELCRAMETDTKQHCSRMRIPHRMVQDPKQKKLSVIDQIKNIPAAPATTNRKLNMRSSTSIGFELKMLFGTTLEKSHTPGSDSLLARLAQFLEFSGGLRATLEAFDVTGSKGLTQEDFCNGLEAMAYPHGDPKALFAMLDEDNLGEMDLILLEERLRRFLSDTGSPANATSPTKLRGR